MVAVSGAQPARSCGTARDEACYSVPWLAQHGARLFRGLERVQSCLQSIGGLQTEVLKLWLQGSTGTQSWEGCVWR